MKKVLVIDDEYAILDTLRVLLEDEGYRVVAAEDGARGLELLAQEVPDVVLLDMMMPVVDGRGVLLAMQESPRFASIPVVVMSAAGPPALRDLPPVRAILRKPFSVDQLLTVLEAALR